MKLDLKQAEMIKGTEKRSYFMVFAKKNGLKIAIRPLVFPAGVKFPGSEKTEGYFHLGFRLRVVSIGGDVDDADEVFGIKGFHTKGEHASLVGGVPVCTMPCIPNEVLKICYAEQIPLKIGGSLAAHMEKVGAEMLVPPDMLPQYIESQLEQLVPEIHATQSPDMGIRWYPEGKSSQDEDDE